MATGDAKIDRNWKPTLIAVSSVDGVTPVNVEADPTTGALLTSGGGGSGGDVNLTQVGGVAVALGQTTKSASLPVTIASDQGSIGSVTANIGTTNGLALDATLTGGTQQTKITDGTQTANTVPGDTGYNSLIAGNGIKTYTFTTSATGAQILGPYDLRGYAYVQIVLTSAGSGLAWTAMWSPTSGGTYVGANSWFASNQSTNAGAGLTTAANIIAESSAQGNFLQLNISAMTSGTTTGTITLSTFPRTPHTLGVSAGQSGTWTVQPGNTANTTPWLITGSGTAGTAATGVVTIQGIASMTKLLVTPDANSSVNLSQLAGNSISSGVGASGTGTLRTAIANDAGRTLVSAGGSVANSGNNTLVSAGTNKLKVYAFSLTTTSTTAITCIFQSGAGGTELWRVVLQAPTGANTGANLSVAVPSYLFATASATLLNLNLSSAQTVHWSCSYYDEA